MQEYDENKPVIFHLYGIFDNADSLVLTENNILDFFASVIKKDPGLPKNILNDLKDKSTSLLFIGFGFKQWYLRIMLHILGILEKENRSFALEKQVLSNMEEFRRTIIFFSESDYKIRFFDKEPTEFTQELKKRYHEKYICTPADYTQTNTQDDMPTVFICRANEDKEKANEICKKLKSNDLRPWIDKENLRGGDNWDKEIKKNLSKVEYCLIINSKSLEKKIRGYVNKEIKIAFKIQKEFQPGFSFIIPIKIEDCNLRDDIKSLQIIDFSKDWNKGCQDMVEAIKKDFARRDKRKRCQA